MSRTLSCLPRPTLLRTLLILVTLMSSLSVGTHTSSPVLAASPSALAAAEATDGYLRGVNLAGAEFADDNLPGTYGQTYIYPNATELDYYKAKGLTLIRLPFRWERLQRSLYGPFDAAELARMDEFVSAARARGMKVILDPHNYALYHGNLIGSAAVPNSAFTDFWRRLADHYRNELTIYAYGLMNEPNNTNGLWPAAAQAGVDGIRAVDSTHMILVPGDGWSGAWSWQQNNANLSVNDPANNFMYEAHQYFDNDHSGKYDASYDQEGAYPNVGVDRVKPFVDWLKAHNARGFLGEYGVPDDDGRWLTVLDNFLGYLDANGIGGTYWAGGPWWGTSYRLSVEPINGQDRPQMAVLVRHLGRVATSTPAPSAVLDDFESGDTTRWHTYNSSGSTITKAAVSPGAVGTYAMKVDYGIASGGWAGTGQSFGTPRDWRGYDALSFRLYGTNSGNTIRVELMDNRAPNSTGDTSERFVRSVVDDFTGWKEFTWAWRTFARRTDWQPAGAPNDHLTLSEVYGFNVSPVGGSGSFSLDQVELTKPMLLAGFEDGSLDGWTAFRSSGTAITPSAVSPGKVGTGAIKVDYSIAQGGYGGVAHDFVGTPQNWTPYATFGFWFYGNNTGRTIRLEVMDDRPEFSTTDTWERFEYRFTDSFVGWKRYNLPWSAFTRRTDWQPGGAPNNGFTRTGVGGYNFSPISGSGSFQVDQVELVR